MGLILDRTVSRVSEKGETGSPEPLAAYRGTPVYVLLGDPGAGKTTAFLTEASVSSNGALFVSARDFLTLNPVSHPEWGERTLFIDGLDEVRAGQSDARTPFDAIRARLDELRPPGFRISCRDADWLGKNDAARLESISPQGAVVVLRLTALNHQEIRQVVSHDDRILDPDAFLLGAHDRGLGELLQNPQTLDLLIKAFGATGQWPETRRETFERGIEQVAREPNDEHQIGQPEVPLPAILDAAGVISAVHLLSGGARHCLLATDAQTGDVPISAYGEQLHAAGSAALRTRLFTDPAPRRFEPAHANFAAFLAARTLAARLAHGLPYGRVLALLAGDDGAPPTSLRGLAAWLAVFSPELRESLIKRDPVAVLMYGDIREFKPGEKAGLLEEIAGNPSRLYEGRWPDSALAGLASADMEPTLHGLLADPDPSDAKQKVVEIVAKALTQAPPNEHLTDILLDVCRDETRWFQVREFALDAWIHSLADNPARDDRLREVLGWIREDSIKDYGGENLGTLLRELYPRVLGPAELWEYFGVPSRPLIGRFYRFWSDLPDTSPPDHLPAHLDYLAQSGDAAHSSPDLPRPNGLPLRFLARTIKTYGERVEMSQLTAWLRVGLDEWGMLRPEGFDTENASSQIRQWLEAHPETQKAVIRFALRTDQFRELESVEYHLNELLYRSSLPEDIGAWHLDQAVTAEDADLTTKHLMEFTRSLARRPVGVDATLADARSRLRGRPDASHILDSLLRSRLPEWHLRNRNRWQHVRAGTVQPDASLLRAVRSEEEELENNCASPGLLHSLAQKYYGHRQVRDSPGGREHLVQALGSDERLTEVALGAIRRTIERDDLPSAEELVRLRRGNLMSAFVWPVLIGLADRPADKVVALGDARLRAALACRLLQLGLAQEAAWYKRCVRERPDLVAEVLILVGRVLFAAGETSFPDLRQLARDKDHAEVARQATLPLLRAFPARASDSQLVLLDALLWSGLLHLATDGQNLASFRALVESKARQRSTTRIARVRWLASGLILDPERFQPELAKELRGSDKRVRSLARFCQPFGYERLERLTPATLEFLIRTLGGHGDPPIADLTIRQVDGIALLLPRLITQLSQDPTRSATEALGRLAADDRLSKWRPSIEGALDAQRVVRRDAAFAPPAPDKLIAALRDGAPANAADLRELVVDRLQQISKEMRTTNANLWRQFWNEDTKSPKHENACRDALLALLRPRLPEGCDAQPEGQHAANKRSDIRIATSDWSVPVEIKKNAHSEVWSAVRNQLLPRYTNDPATEGLGIYLVLWFGPEQTASVPAGRKPTTPDAMRDRLLADLTSEERRRAVVIVMDVTPP